MTDPDTNIELSSIDSVTYIGDDGEKRRRYWKNGELHDHPVGEP
jgi:hypothetical protein